MSINIAISINHNGKTYPAKKAKIVRTLLGLDGPRPFLSELILQAGNTGARVGGQRLTEKNGEGSAYGLDQIRLILETVGVDTWEELKGADVYALFDSDEDWGAQCVGIANIRTGKAFIHQEHADAWRARDEVQVF